MESNEIIKFWFVELKPQDWFKKDDRLDTTIRERFLDIHRKATKGELFHWRDSFFGRLAEIIILDQFSRNIYRGTPLSFAFDNMALILAQEAVRVKADQELSLEKKQFIYLPYMHSESPLIHLEAAKLYSQKGMELGLDFELKHKEIIDRFGRYPHRNVILGRESTHEEVEFLKGPDSYF
jgi:uncharacterized protein (DUF924 family)